MTLHESNRGGILAEEVEQLLNEIARGNTRDVFKKPAALQALLDFRLLTQDDFVFSMTPVAWKYVTCPKALAIHRLQG